MGAMVAYAPCELAAVFPAVVPAACAVVIAAALGFAACWAAASA
jgi:hypothetical protein